jgi:hypothetical protein
MAEPMAEIKKWSVVMPISDEQAADAAAIKTAWDEFWNATPEQHAQRQAGAAERRSLERASAPVRLLFDVGSLDILLDRLGISPDLAEHMVQPYCTCSIGYDGLDVCPHARDLGLGP